ncbi:MAG: fused MFS/spermidine synthase [Candidatus Marinimicrobia bacterium]|nr:fused MFS/spermidine synthase [Candidatus Neomarinimicrobiota bacterium]
MNTRFRKSMLLVYFLSGVSGLIYQIIWLRFLAEIFGNGTYALSTVLAAFMAGLAIGSWQGGQIKFRNIAPIKLYIRLEIGIALAAIVISVLLANYDTWYAPIYRLFQGHLAMLTIAQFLTCFLLVFIPTSLMGATVPTMATIVMTNINKVGRDFSLMYALNTLGGMMGVILSSFLMIEKLGLYWTLLFAISINLLIGLGILLVFRESPSKQANNEIHDKVPKSKNKIISSPIWLIPLIGFATGFIAFSLEILWTRSLVFYIGNTTYSFALILLLILFGIAGGSLLVQRYVDQLKNKWNWIIGILIFVAIGTFTSIPLFHTVFTSSAFAPDFSTWRGYLLQNLYKTTLVVFIPSFGMGLTFPLLNTLYIESIQLVGKRVGSLYAWNTFGAILGSVITGFLFVPILGISATIIGTSILIIGIIATIKWHLISFKYPKVRFQLGWGLFIVMLSLWIGLINFLEHPQFKSYDEHDISEVIFYDEGVSATTTVYFTESKEKKMTVEGVLMGGDFQKAMRKQIILADLPLLLRPDAKSIYVVGLGTGITFHAFHQQQPNAQIICSEISASVIKGSQHFQALSTNVASFPNVQLHLEDGKNYLKFNSEHFDIISSDTMLKKGSAGNSTMYSSEYYKLCRNRLTENGIFIQWVPLYLSSDIHQIILKTIRNIFPHTTLWYVGDEALVHISSLNPLNLDYSILSKAFQNDTLKQSFQQIGIENLDAILSTYLMDDQTIDAMVQSSVMNSLVHPIVEFMTPRELASNSYAFVIENLINLTKSAGSISNNKEVLSHKNISQAQLKSLDETTFRFQSIMDGLMYSYAGKVKEAKQRIAHVLASNPNDSNAKHYLGISLAYPNIKSKARSYLEAGIVLRELGADSLALSMLNHSLEIAPNNLVTLNELSLVYLSTGAIEGAIDVTKKMILANPKIALFHFNLGYYYEQQGKFSEAMAAYNESKKLNPNNEALDYQIKNLKKLTTTTQ